MKTPLLPSLLALKNEEMAEHAKRFFKTGKGEYGEGDEFLGIRVPVLRKIAKAHKNMPDAEREALLKSPYHEVRLVVLYTLVYEFEKADEKRQQEIFEFYLEHLDAVNNWDLVDTSTPHIVGQYLLKNPQKSRAFLYTLAESKNLWERRISILATHAFIRTGEYADALRIAEKLLTDPHDLIHKAVGWMLREIGKRDEKLLTSFLDRLAHKMPRTMLRYAIERFPEEQRKQYLDIKPDLTFHT